MIMGKINRREAIAGGASLGFLTSSSALAHPGHDDDRPLGAWTRMADMPTPVQEIYPTAHRMFESRANSFKPVINSVLVNAGGLTDASGYAHNVTDEVTIYDPLTDRWQWGPPLPFPLHHIALVSNSGFLYGIGGFRRDNNGGWQMQDRVWVLDNIETGPWRPLKPMPIPQAEVVAVSLRGKVHVVGGRSPAGSLNREWGDHIDTDKHWVYDAANDRWEPRAGLRKARNSAAGAVWSDALYYIGGRTVERGNTADVNVYDPVTDRWQRAAPLPKSSLDGAPLGQGGLAAATWNGYIYAFGGEWFGSAGNGVYAEVWEYDPREDKWRGVAAMPRPRHGLGAVTLKDGVYVCGGASRAGGNGTSLVLDRFSL